MPQALRNYKSGCRFPQDSPTPVPRIDVATALGNLPRHSGKAANFLDKTAGVHGETAGVSGKETGFLAEAVDSVAKTMISCSRNWVTWS